MRAYTVLPIAWQAPLVLDPLVVRLPREMTERECEKALHAHLNNVVKACSALVAEAQRDGRI
jgi:hypothetical protein